MPKRDATLARVRSSEPYVTSDGRRRNMAAIRRTNTRPEVALRSALHRLGLRFRKDLLLVAAGRRVRPDIVFTKSRLAVFVDGCFWHCCPEHGRSPRNNSEYWNPKLARNRDRDAAQNLSLNQAGWRVLRLWEHESLEEMVAAVTRALRQPG